MITGYLHLPIFAHNLCEFLFLYDIKTSDILYLATKMSRNSHIVFYRNDLFVTSLFVACCWIWNSAQKKRKRIMTRSELRISISPHKYMNIARVHKNNKKKTFCFHYSSKILVAVFARGKQRDEILRQRRIFTYFRLCRHIYP